MTEPSERIPFLSVISHEEEVDAALAGTYQDGAEQLQDYLRLVLLALRRHIARHAHRLIQANGTLSDLYVSFVEADMLLARPQAYEGQPAVGQRMGWPSAEECHRELTAHAARVRQRSDTADPSLRLPIEELRRLFHLSELQVRVLVAAAAPVISVDVARLYGFAWADFSIKTPSVGFLAELLADDPRDSGAVVSELSGDSALVRYRLVELNDVTAWGTPTPHLHRAVRIPDRLVSYLRAQPEPVPARIADACLVEQPEWALPREQLILSKETVSDLEIALGQALQNPRALPRLLLVGPSGSGRATAILTLLSAHGWGLLTADLDRLIQEGERFEQSLVEVCREALLRRCLLLVRGDNLLQDMAELTRISRPLTRVLNSYEGPMALSVSQRVPALHRLISDLFEVTFTLPNAAEQRILWQRAADQLGCALAEDVPQLLTQRFSVTPGAIFRSVEEARTRAALFAHHNTPVELRPLDLTQAIRRKTVHVLGSVASPFSTSLGWDDVVLPAEVMRTLKEILAHAKHREKVYDEWGFSKKVAYGRGLSCLFAGPPGTGKTMMAAVLAQTLGKELYRVDLSRVVSKWVGETEKNLSVAFDEAERGQLILLFDEADSLFSKRTKQETSNDRFANMEINYLLQRMEAYDGMTVLTTNKEKAMDEAFRRRIKFKVHFPMPDPVYRAQLWKAMIPAEMRIEANIAFDFLGKEFEMAGGNIKNAVIRAAFYAAEAEGIITHDMLYDAALAEAKEMGMVVRHED